MINLNLISPNQKDILKAQTIFKFAENFLGLLLVIISIIAIIIIPYYFKATTIAESINESNKPSKPINNDLSEKVKQLNYQANIIAKISNSNYDWPNLLNDFGVISNGLVIFNELTGSVDTKEINIKGRSNSRDKFIAFIDKLKALVYIESIDSPLSNYLSETDVNFILKIKLK